MRTRHAPPPGFRRPPVPLLALAGALLAAPSAQAQTYASAYRIHYNANGGDATTVCGRDNSGGTLDATPIAFDCMLEGIRGAGAASVDDGILKAFGTVSTVDLSSPGGYTRGAVYVTDHWSDRVFFNAIGDVHPATIEVVARFTGSTSQANSNGLHDGSSLVGSQGAGVLYAAYGSTSNSRQVNFLAEEGANSDYLPAAAYDELLPLSMPFSPFLDFFLDLRFNDYMAVYTPGGDRFTGFETTDFSHTAGLSGLIVRDASGNDITSQMEFSFANGTQLLAVTAAPEPTTFVLLASGLAAIGGVTRRRRQRTA